MVQINYEQKSYRHRQSYIHSFLGHTSRTIHKEKQSHIHTVHTHSDLHTLLIISDVSPMRTCRCGSLAFSTHLSTNINFNQFYYSGAEESSDRDALSWAIEKERETENPSLLSEMTERQTARNIKKLQIKGEAERWWDRHIQQETEIWSLQNRLLISAASVQTGFLMDLHLNYFLF